MVREAEQAEAFSFTKGKAEEEDEGEIRALPGRYSVVRRCWKKVEGR